MTQQSYNTRYKLRLSLTVLALVMPNILWISISIAAEQTEDWRYTVRPKDTLIQLGRTHLINSNDWKQLQIVNHINNPYKLPIGMVLHIPLALVKQYSSSAEVISVSGDARWQSTATPLEPLTVGQKLGVGTKLFTKDRSRVVIRFADDTETTMDSNSELSLNTMSVYSGGVMVDT